MSCNLGVSHPMGCETDAGEVPHRRLALPVVNFAAVCRSHDSDSQLCVEHVIDHSVVTYPDAPRSLFTDKFLRPVGSWAVRQAVDRFEYAIARRSWKLLHLPRRGRSEFDAIGHEARSARNSSSVTRVPSSDALASR